MFNETNNSLEVFILLEISVKSIDPEGLSGHTGQVGQSGHTGQSVPPELIDFIPIISIGIIKLLYDLRIKKDFDCHSIYHAIKNVNKITEDSIGDFFV